MLFYSNFFHIIFKRVRMIVFNSCSFHRGVLSNLSVFLFLFFITTGTVSVPSKARAQGPSTNRDRTLKVAEVVEVDQVVSAIPFGFDLLTHGKHQFVSYYNADRRLIVAVRKRGTNNWKRMQLDERAPWDSHHGSTMAVDQQGYLHLSGNMHGDPLNYYRTDSNQTFQQINEMVGRDENSVTYPRFLKTRDGRLVFMYRDGGSGNGRRLVNIYNADRKTWSRFLDEPLLDGSGHDMNAYPHGPKRGPDGRFHIVWMWRNTPDAATNHHISYMRSENLREWETAGGKPVQLPVTPENKSVVVDPVPSREGLINMGYALGFDHRNRPIVSYHKYDEEGNSQIYNARWEGNGWKIHQMSSWDVRWEFGGGGSIPSRVGSGRVRPVAEGKLAQPYYHWKAGNGTALLDADTLQVIGETTIGYRKPSELTKPRSDVKGMEVHWKGDSGSSGKKRVRYQLRWESLEPNRDRKPDRTPEPSTLEVYKFIEPAP